MTGFARVRRSVAQGELTLSLKSVNHRGLDLHFHLPGEFDEIETELRGALKSGIARGHVQIHLSLTRGGEEGKSLLNRELLDAYLLAFREARDLHGFTQEPDLNEALRVPGMLTSGGGDSELPPEVKKAALELVAEAVAELNRVREREGEATAEEIEQRCRNISGLVARMEEIRAGATAAFHKRLREKLAELLHGVNIDPQRLAQEAALLADRSDISEELVRPADARGATGGDDRGGRRGGEEARFSAAGNESGVEHGAVEDGRAGGSGVDDHGAGAGGEGGDR